MQKNERLQKEAQMKELIKAALYRFDADDLIRLLAEVASNSDKDDLKCGCLRQLEGEGYTVLKIDSLAKQNQLNDFLCSEIFPYYNEQQSYLFA
jgi:hypothetical protein